MSAFLVFVSGHKTLDDDDVDADDADDDDDDEVEQNSLLTVERTGI